MHRCENARRGGGFAERPPEKVESLHGVLSSECSDQWNSASVPVKGRQQSGDLGFRVSASLRYPAKQIDPALELAFCPLPPRCGVALARKPTMPTVGATAGAPAQPDDRRRSGQTSMASGNADKKTEKFSPDILATGFCGRWQDTTAPCCALERPRSDRGRLGGGIAFSTTERFFAEGQEPGWELRWRRCGFLLVAPR